MVEGVRLGACTCLIPVWIGDRDTNQMWRLFLRQIKYDTGLL